LLAAKKLPAQNLSGGNAILKINSTILKEERNVLVRLPAEYERLPKEKFPVIYMLDGENRNPQMMATVADHLTANFQMPPVILVSIPNTDRTRDLTPTAVADFPTSGGGNKFLDFLDREVFPEIEENYRTQPYRIFAGHSFGGLTVIYTLLTRPEMFNAYLAASPALFWDEQYVTRRLPALAAKQTKRKRIIFVGLGDEPELIKEYTSFKNKILLAGPKNLDYEFKLFPGENHASAILPEYYYGLKNIYEGWSPILKIFPLPKTWLAEMETHFRQLSAKYGYEIKISESLVNGIGYGLLYQEKRVDDAIAAFRKNVELYPESPNVYDSLGEAYEVKGNLASAKDNYEKAYKLAESKGDSALAKTARANYERVSAKIK
jgi:predicted alpha/beta superfamily hydrolase